MHVISVRNVNHALPQGVAFLRAHGKRRPSRNGDTLVAPTPVTTVYECPMERVLHSPDRDANPFFHLVEAIWMLSGSNDLSVLTPYVKRMAKFSDDGGLTMPGAYGFRWRRRFGTDQLDWAVRRLAADANDRRVVIQMYDCQEDQANTDIGGKDVPCNLVITPMVADDGRLDMTVFCRSNDIIWGAYGANAVHFSVLQEYLARRLKRDVGRLYQVSNNYHLYLDAVKDVSYWSGDLYQDGRWTPLPMYGIENATREEFRAALLGATGSILQPFLNHTVVPMVNAHKTWRATRSLGTALAHLGFTAADDWRAAALDWLNRRAT